MKNNYSKFIIVLIIVILTITTFNIKNWKNHRVIINDVNIYYSYLPATFIYKDLTFRFVDKLPKDFPGVIWYVKTEDGKRVQKCTMGLAFLYMPFFIAAHVLALLFGFSTSGYSQIYQFFIDLSSLFYSILGLILLRKILMKYFKELTVCFTLISIYLGTNLFYYITSEGGMAHAYNFFLFAVAIYYSIKWHKTQKIKYAAIIGITIGIITLIRPTNILIVIFPLLYKVNNIEDFKNKLSLFYKYRLHILTLIILLISVAIPQIIYWKYSTGHWVYFSYKNETEGNQVERFFFLKPHIIDGFFSYRKGFLIYTPIMIFAFLGLIKEIISEKGKGKIDLEFFNRKVTLSSSQSNTKREKSDFLVALILFAVLNTYIVLSWWCWWYGGSFGLRAFIDSYALLALPMAAFYDWIFTERGKSEAVTMISRIKGLIGLNKLVKIIFTMLITAIIFLNLFQTLQYRYCHIHWDSMTKQAYWNVFGKLQYPSNQDKLLKTPDYSAAIKGEKER